VALPLVWLAPLQTRQGGKFPAHRQRRHPLNPQASPSLGAALQPTTFGVLRQPFG